MASLAEFAPRRTAAIERGYSVELGHNRGIFLGPAIEGRPVRQGFSAAHIRMSLYSRVPHCQLHRCSVRLKHCFRNGMAPGVPQTDCEPGTSTGAPLALRCLAAL